jgi:hypothetical protein
MRTGKHLRAHNQRRKATKGTLTLASRYRPGFKPNTQRRVPSGLRHIVT